MTGVLARFAARSQVTVSEALVIAGLGIVYVAVGLGGGLLLAVYA